MPETHLKRNLWTEMTGITTVEQYERLYGPGSFERAYKEQQECNRRIHDRLRFHIGPDGKTYEARADGLYCEGVKVEPTFSKEPVTFRPKQVFWSEGA